MYFCKILLLYKYENENSSIIALNYCTIMLSYGDVTDMNTQISPRPEQKERIRHGEAAFPIQRYTTRLDEKKPDVKAHWHEEAELTLVTSGSSMFQLQLESYIVQGGDIIFVSPLQLHAFGSGKDRFSSETYVFHMNLLSSGADDVCNIRYVLPITGRNLCPPFIIGRAHPAYSTALDLFYKIGDAWRDKQPGYEMLVKAYLLCFMALLVPYCEYSSESSESRTGHVEKIKAALEFTAEHYSEDIAVSDVAEVCHFSKYHFMRFFKKYMGMTYGNYLKNLRLEKAAESFNEGETDILEISMRVGFHNLSYFYREFHRKYGMTPKHYIDRGIVEKGV